jgi:hypothetical protein
VIGGNDVDTQHPTPVSTPHRLLLDHPLVFFSVAALLMVGPHVLPPTEISQVSTDSKDTVIQLWNFWWTKQWLLQSPQNPYWTDLLYAPFGTSLAFAPYSLPYSLISVPIQLLVPGMTGLVLAFNVIVFVSFVLSGYGAHRLALHVTGNPLASLIAGLVFAFMPFHVLNIKSLYLLCMELLPFYVLALIQLWEQPSFRRSARLAIWLALTFYSSLEYSLYLVLFSSFWLGYVLIVERGELHRLQWIGLVQAGGLFLVLAAPLLIQQVQVSSRMETVPVERGLSEVVHWSPALLSFITPSRVHPVYGGAMMFAGEYPDPEKWGMRSEATLGWVALCLAAYGLVRGRGRGNRNGHGNRSDRRFWAIAFGVFAILSLGPQLRVSGTWLSEIPLPYRALYELVPLLRGSRDPTRLLPLVMLLLSVLTAFGAAALLERCTDRRRQILVAAGMAALVLFEDLVASAPSIAPTVDPIYSELATLPEEAAIIDLTPSLLGMLAQTVHGRPISYVADISIRGTPLADDFAVEQAFWMPRRVLDLAPTLRTPEVDRLVELIRERGVAFIVFPVSPISTRQSVLARAMGARVSPAGDYVLCDFRPDGSGWGDE